MIALVIRPRFDDATDYSYRWAGELVDALSRKFTVVDIGNRRVTRAEVEATIKSRDPVIIVFYNHGTEDAWWGSPSEKIIDTNNVDLLSGRIVYTMACLTGEKLGTVAWRKKCKVYVGYTEPFGFTVYDEEKFKIAANSGMIAYIDGEEDWANIKRIMIDTFNRMIEEADDVWTKMLLRSDRDALIVYDGEEPKTKCVFRRIALRLFGRYGWMIDVHLLFVTATFFTGLGISLHDYAHVLFELGGYREVLSLQGGYIGFIMMIASFVYALYRYAG